MYRIVTINTNAIVLFFLYIIYNRLLKHIYLWLDCTFRLQSLMRFALTVIVRTTMATPSRPNVIKTNV